MKKPKTYGGSEDAILRLHIELARSFLKIRAKELIWLKKYDLTGSQFGILEALYHLGEMSVGEITQLTLSTPGNMTVVIKNLQSKELIEVYASQEDRRTKLLQITSKGVELMDTVFPKHLQNIVGYYDTILNSEEIKVFAKLLRKLEKGH